MKRVLVLGVLALCVGGILSCLNWTDGIPCRTDLHCPDNYHCAADGGCAPGASTGTNNRDAGGGRG